MIVDIHFLRRGRDDNRPEFVQMLARERAGSTEAAIAKAKSLKGPDGPVETAEGFRIVENGKVIYKWWPGQDTRHLAHLRRGHRAHRHFRITPGGEGQLTSNHSLVARPVLPHGVWARDNPER
jgi:hypothetical protein